MSKRKGNAADLLPSKKEKKGLGQYILGFFLLLYTLFCGLRNGPWWVSTPYFVTANSF